MTDKTRKIVDIDDLKRMTYKNYEPFFIVLPTERVIVSSKEIRWSGRKYFYVTHLVDGSKEKLTIEELKESYIGKAIKAGCLYWEDTDPSCFI